MVSKFAETIYERDIELIIRRLEGESQSSQNPFSKKDLTFDYSKIDTRHHASLDREEELVLYKGALRGYENTGLLSLALRRGLVDYVNEVRAIIEGGNEEIIRELFEVHTSYYSHTALLSATFNPEQAQVFAPTRDRTIYQLKVRADRCVIDRYGVGGCGNNGELLILGAIFPEEVVAVKTSNEYLDSELLTPERIIRWFPDKDSRNRDVKDPSNWRHLINF